MNAKDIVSKEFDTVKRGGYDAAEVDTFLKCRMKTRSSKRSWRFLRKK